ncbi:MAG: xanthine dehydrogenase family protein subunit M [Herpetosiphonaceae bacterium]|nr:xanthine dehydrogenase family protein subunit M [Herpetosiphonaceae bacterium]
MKNFTHIDAQSIEHTIPLLDYYARPLAGGTDLIPLMREGVWQPDRLVNLKPLADLHFLREAGDGLHIGALTTLDELDRSPLVRERYQALAEAAHSAASPQLRNMATLGGNLLQQVRCWYYRGPFNCWMKGGDHCPARSGENEHHAVFDQSPCVAVYPSDPPAALITLDASIRIVGPDGARSVKVADFLAPPDELHRVMHGLGLNELITEIVVPHTTARSLYLKAMDRAVWAYALVSVAVAGEVANGTITNPRIVLGAVANVPVRLGAVEALIDGQLLTDELIKEAGTMATHGMEPLAHNHYKLPLARNLVRQALRDLTGQRM